MKYPSALLLLLFAWLLSACGSEACPPNSLSYITDPAQLSAQASMTRAGSTPTPSLVEISGKMIQVDRVIEGVLCNDTWNGTVYVTCNLQVAEWSKEEGPTFLKNCNLKIEPGTVVYVAAHHDAAYYNGCSCHTGEGKK